MGPQRGRGPIQAGSHSQAWAFREGLFAVGSIELLDHLLG